MKTTSHPYNFGVAAHFSNARRICAWEGGAAYIAEQAGVPYVILDEGTLADFLDDSDRDMLDELVKVIAFESAAERTEYIRTRWPGIAASREDEVRFLPWVGSRYGTEGHTGIRLLVLGESHYHATPDPGSDFTGRLTKGYIDGTVRHRFWTLVAKAIAGTAASGDECKDFWRSVAFYNYVQSIVGLGPRISPTAGMWKAAEAPFREVLRRLTPHAIVVLGRRLWDNVPLGKSWSLAIQDGAWPARIYEAQDRSPILVTFIDHPASRGFSPSAWTSVVTTLLEQARSPLTQR